jgi:hypothetical protein
MSPCDGPNVLGCDRGCRTEQLQKIQHCAFRSQYRAGPAVYRTDNLILSNDTAIVLVPLNANVRIDLSTDLIHPGPARHNHCLSCDYRGIDLCLRDELRRYVAVTDVFTQSSGHIFLNIGQ